MSRLIRTAIDNRVFPNLLMLALLAIGLFGLSNLTVKNFPEISTGAVSVTVPFPGASPQDVADGILKPIENEVRALEGVRKITGSAQQSLATVTVDLQRGADVATVRDDIETAVAGITTFPGGAEDPVIVEVDPQELAIQYILSGDIALPQLRDIARAAQDGLQSLDGISSVEVTGAPGDEISVEIDRRALRAYGLSLNGVADIIAAENLDLSGGILRSGETRLQVRALGEEVTGADLTDIVIVSDGEGPTVTLGDIATIRDGLAEDATLATLDGAPAIYLTVYRSGNEQVLDIVETSRAFLENDFAAYLPETVTLTEWRNEADSLRGRIDLLVKNAAIGAALILLLLTLFLDLRIAFWVSAGIAVSFFATFGLMLVFGVSINQLSLFGFILALGIVVDDAIVVGESVYEERQQDAEGIEAAKTGASRMARPVVYAVLTTIAAFVPLLFLPGTSGSFIGPVAAVVIMVLALSLVESFLILPQHLAHLSTDPPRRWSPRRATDWARDRVGRGFDRLRDGPVHGAARFAARQPLFVILALCGVLAASTALLTSGKIRFVFFPEIEGNFIASTVELPAGTSETRTLEVAQDIAEAAGRAVERLADAQSLDAERVLQATAIAVGFNSGSGGPEGSGGGGFPNRATIDLKIEDSETRDFPAADLERLWREEVGAIPGARELTFSASLVGVGAPISLQVSAATEDAREGAVAELRAALGERDGVFAIRSSDATAAEEVRIRLSPEAEALGVRLATVASEVRAAVFGALAADFVRDREEVEVRVRLPEDQRMTLADIAELRIPVGEARVPLSSLASLTLAPAPTSLTRLDGREITAVEADVDIAVTSGSVETSHVLETVLPELQDSYQGVEISLGGEQEEQGRFGAAITQNFTLALFAMFAILALAFQSFTKPILMLATVPFGLFGALVGHALVGINLTLLSIFGIIGLSGILINASLLILNAYETRIAGDTAPDDTTEAIADAVASRTRPIVLTTLTTALGITPLILEQSLQAQFLIPTAVSLGFGIFFGAIFVLLLMPALIGLHVRVADILSRDVALPFGKYRSDEG
ncbi:efflux RND transporter permease subunit [Pseudaestuariivita sp.]|uniref:efflux RND transporter permease subunit n=1 Tax=Pseudaestuariivita sp. TaxID=2211669 RepID=UPI0040588CCC